MRKMIIIFILLVLLFVLSTRIDGNSGFSYNTAPVKFSSIGGEKMNVYYFYGEGCPHCSRVEPFITQIEHGYTLQLHKFEVYNNKENLLLLNDYFDTYNVPLEERGIPAIFTPDSYIIGDVDILNSFEKVVLHSLNGSDQFVSSYNNEKSVEPNLSLLSIAVAALADSINPCSMAILLFLMTGLLLLRKRERALKVGFVFALSVFIANILFGMGILAMLRLSNFSSMFKLTAGGIAMLTGILLIKDCFFHSRGRFVMEVPNRFRPLLKRHLGKAFFGKSAGIIGIFLAGFLVTSLEVPCTGGPYFYVLAGLADDALRLQMVPILLFYNAIFIMPLILISALLYFGSIHIERTRDWKDRNKHLINLIRGFMMLALGFYTIPTANLIQLIITILSIYKVLFVPITLFFSFYVASKFIANSRLKGGMPPKLRATLTITLLIVTTLAIPMTMQNATIIHATSLPAASSSTSSVLDDQWSEWASKPVKVNVQVNLEQEGDQATIYNILEEIEEYGWRATVFVTGEFAFDYGETVKDIENRGHQIAVYGWQKEEDLTILDFQGQLELIQRSFSAVRNATSKPTGVLDFKPQGYKYNDDTIKALQEFGAKSISGLFSCQESFCKCWYAQQLGKIVFPYPITNEFWAIPISTVKVSADDLPLDDEYIDSSSNYLSYLLEKYSQQNKTKDPLIMVVHASITGADQMWLNTLVQFLDYVENNNGKIVTVDSLRHHTAYITDFDITGPTSAAAGAEITITVQYTSNVYCPYYRFILYGRYPSQEWGLIENSPLCEFVYTGPHTFTKKVTIPRPPSNENVYTIRAVGRGSFGGCPPSLSDPKWPSYNNYEVMDELEVTVSTRCIPVPSRTTGNPNGKIDVVFVPDDDYGTADQIDTWLPQFLSHVNQQIDDRLGGRAPVSGNLNKFNFYYTRDQGSVSDSNCAQRRSLPRNIIRDCPFADVFVVLHTTIFDDCSTRGNRAPSIFSAEGPPGRSFIHESGHAIFDLSDEYPDPPQEACTGYFQADPCPNTWNSLQQCRNDAVAEGWDPDDCFQFVTNHWCWNLLPWRTGDWWKLGTTRYIMYDGDYFNNGWGEPASRRINWVLSQYKDPPQLARAILLELNISDTEITLLESMVINDFPPNYIPGAYNFTARTFSFEGELLGEYGFADPRIILGEQGYTGPTWLHSVDFPLILPYFYNSETVNIYNQADELLLSIDISEYATGVINGAVTNTDGLPVSNAFIQAQGPAAGSAFTDEDGNFELVGLQPGTYTVSVGPNPYDNLMPASMSVEVYASLISTTNFVLQPAASIAGVVTDVEGAPISGVHLYLSGYETPYYQTNEEGKYIIPALEAGTYTVNIDAPSYGSWYILVNDKLVKYATSVVVDVTISQTTWVDFSQQPPPMPDIWVDPMSIELTLPKGGIAERILTIGNDGDEVLEFEIAILVGGSVFDPSEGGLADIAYIYATIEESNINFLIETYNPLPDYLSGILWLDTDQNPSTGVTDEWWPGYGLNDIGADYAVTIDIWIGYSQAYLYRWTNDYFEFVLSFPASLDTYFFTLPIALSNIADDGRLDFTFITYRDGYEVVPNEGHGTSAIVPGWASTSSGDGQIIPSSETAITVSINTTQMEVGEYIANIIISNNDLDESIVRIPLYLTVSPDIIPPTTSLDIGSPKYVDTNGNVFVTSDTPFNLTASDNPGGSGVAATSYRVHDASYDSGWLTYASSFYLSGLNDGTYFIDYNSTDSIRNVEATKTATVILDNTPPATSLTIGEPKIVYAGNTYVNSSTPFTITATDNPEGSGVATTAYKIYNATYDSGWIAYTGTFNLPNWLEKGGTYHIAYNSTDNLGNTETTKRTTIIIILHKVKVEIKPALIEVKPGQTATYTINVTNLGNLPDTYNLTITLIDFNGLCEADPTIIQTPWTLLDKTSLTLNPGEWDTTTFTIAVPANWAGMEDATYNFTATATCQEDPTVNASALASLTVKATKRSMSEYVKLEIQWLRETVNRLEIKEGIKNSLLAKLANAEMKVDQAIQWINQGRETPANNMLNTAQNIIQAFINEVKAQTGKEISPTDAQTLIQTAQNIQQNIQKARNTPLDN